MTFNKKFLSITALILLLLAADACSYSFTGASVPAHLKSIHIANAKDKTGSGIGFMSQYFTEKLIDNFVSDNNLQYVENPKADAKMDCTISTFSDRPISVTNINPNTDPSSNNKNLREISISITVVYRDQVKRKTLINKAFSDKVSYDTDNYEVNREAAVKQLLDKLAEDILLGAVSNW